ncbi:MAG: hypothetical protein ACLFUJ_14790 [Phycisphaerae bacterium]
MQLQLWLIGGLLLLYGALLAVTLWLDHIARLKIRRWADSSGYALVHMEFQRHFLGLLFWLPMVQRGQWFIEIEDEQGGRRSGWVHFGPWWFEHPWGRIQMEWR